MAGIPFEHRLPDSHSLLAMRQRQQTQSIENTELALALPIAHARQCRSQLVQTDGVHRIGLQLTEKAVYIHGQLAYGCPTHPPAKNRRQNGPFHNRLRILR